MNEQQDEQQDEQQEDKKPADDLTAMLFGGTFLLGGCLFWCVIIGVMATIGVTILGWIF